MSFDNVKKIDNEFIANTYARFDVAFKSGHGVHLFDYDNKEYIDLGSGIAVNIFGACDDQWQEAVIEQVKKLSHVSNLYYTSPQAELAQLLCEKTGMKKVFFANSGAEANEGAIKCARKYSHDKYGDNRFEIITLKNSFHGRTIATLSATGQDTFHQHFFPFVDGFKFAIANDFDDLMNNVNEKTCAIMLEIVQGEGGVMPLNKEYVQQVAKYAKDNDIMLIVDEVQTGNGRTGYLYSYMAYGIIPDIVTTAKGLAGGLPLGAIMFNEKVAKTLNFGDHGSTFGGNPICAAAALSTLKRIDNTLLTAVKKKSELIFSTLENAKNVVSLSGMGLMIGIETTKNAKDIVNECLKRGVVVLTAKNKVRLLPALNISNEDLLYAINIVKEVIEE